MPFGWWRISYADQYYYDVLYRGGGGTVEWSSVNTAVDGRYCIWCHPDLSHLTLFVENAAEGSAVELYTGASSVSAAAVWQGDRAFHL